MNRFESVTKPVMWFMALLLAALTAGCGGGSGGRDAILGVTPTVVGTAPTVTAVAPLPNAIGVPINTKIITAAFSKPMNATTINATSFTLACGAAGTAGIVGSPKILVPAVPYLVAGPGNVFELVQSPLSPNLPATADCTATVTTAAQDTTGLALLSNFAWTFTTGLVPDTTRPRVTATVPATATPGVTGVSINTAITAAFTKDMDPSTIIAAGTFTVTGPGATAVAGAVTYAVGTRIVTFTPAATLAPSTTYTATITTAATDTVTPANALAGNQAALPAASNYVWTFTTGLASDTTRPRVTLTAPVTTIPGPTAGVPTNMAITAAFTEDMAPLTIIGTSFTVTCAAPCVSPAGAVTYAARTAIFTPTAVLAASTTYTATITTAATDLAGNALAGNQAALPAASNYVWTFTTAATPAPAANVSVLSTNPLNAAGAVCPSASVNATFTVPSGLRMDPLTVDAARFTVTGPGPTSVTPASVVIDVTTGRIATFTPLNPLPLGGYTATITSGVTGVKDMAIPANTMLAPDYSWNFTVVSCVAPPPPPVSHLGTAATFGIMATAATTSTGATMVNGDVSLEPGTSQGIPPTQVNGTIHVNDAASTLARADLLTGYNYYKGLAPGAGVNALGGGADPGALFPLGVPPGTYTSGSTIIASTPMVLDAGGDANAVWVFQIGSSLTTGASVSFKDGIGNPNNVFWVPTFDATIGVGTTFQGTIIAGRDVTAVTGATINGRILAGATTAGTVALQATTVNVPAP